MENDLSCLKYYFYTMLNLSVARALHFNAILLPRDNFNITEIEIIIYLFYCLMTTARSN